jgi:hypothetical protein
MTLSMISDFVDLLLMPNAECLNYVWQLDSVSTLCTITNVTILSFRPTTFVMILQNPLTLYRLSYEIYLTNDLLAIKKNYYDN